MTDFQVTTAKPGNEFWKWRGQDIRFVVHGALNKEGPCVILVHGLFVNADHFRKNGPALADAGFRVFSIDLLGSGYSSKPDPYSEEAKQISGENGRSYVPNGLIDINLGTSRGGSRKSNVALAHPYVSWTLYFLKLFQSN
jgi:pimeloyl-ACP methyl ester carboxylesterase